jgi:MoaA/NifB/PqqE/SkfB family radical SAM enzyme
MDGLSIELTNACNRRCLHCLRNKADTPEFLPLNLARKILVQAKALGFRTICLTGGEVALYPQLAEFLTVVVEEGFTFNLVTNGHRFTQKILPLLMIPENREKLTGVCISLDGAKPETHDALRGPGSFREVIEAATICEHEKISLAFKSVITNFNKEDLTELALLGAGLGAQEQSFLQPYPTPRLLSEGVIPAPREFRSIFNWINNSLAKILKIRLNIEGAGSHRVLFTCANLLQTVNVDYQGNLILCCNLSHIVQEEGTPSSFGREWLADLKEVSLKEGIIRHYDGVAKLMESRLQDMDELKGLTYIPCYWCLHHFGKLDWLRNFPESPWFNGVRGGKEPCEPLDE